MRVLVQNTLTNRQWVGYEGEAGITIGRDASCDVQLDSRFVSALQARVERGADGWEIQVPEGVNPLEMDGKPIEPGTSVKLGEICHVRVIEYLLTFDDSTPEAAETDESEAITELLKLLHANVLHRLDLRLDASGSMEPDARRLEQLNSLIDELLFGEFQKLVSNPPVMRTLLQRALRRRLTGHLVGRADAKRDNGQQAFGLNPALEEQAAGVVQRLAKSIAADGGSDLTEDQIDERFARHFDAAVRQMLENVQVYLVARYVKKLLFDIIFGFGPLQDLIDSPEVSEIMVVDPQLIYIERSGRVARSREVFTSEAAAISVIERIVAPLGRRIDKSQPLVDARLPDGSRVNAVIPPLAVKGPCITIRKFPESIVTIEKLVQWGALSASAVALLDACVKQRTNIVVAGGTGSGKTTLLNALSQLIPDDERIVTIEDSAELQLQQAHVVTLETRPASAEGTGEYTIRDLVKNALRMRPDRIVVGECRGSEAIDMLQAMNTGHDGSMTTLHANGAADVISRLETMVLMGADIPLSAVRKQISDAVDLIVFTQRLRGGRRMVTQVSEVTGMDKQTGQIKVVDILRVVGDGKEAVLKPTGYMPTFLGAMVERKLLDLDAWFKRVNA